MSKIPIALQLYSVRGEVQNSLPDTLKAVADLGYVGAEPWGYGGEEVAWQGHSAADIRKMYDDNGMTCCGIHLQTAALLGDNLARTIEFNQICGNRFLIIAADSVRMGSVEGIAELAGILDETAAKLKPHGMETGYHAHAFDFEVIDGEIAWDRLFSSTGSDVVMQMDIGNCASGGGDPIGMLRKYPGRARSMHLKDHGGPEGAVIGEGDADWPTVFELCETQHATEWYVVEEGGADGLGFDVCKRSLEALKRMGK
ncbi:MAG TPA: sugar phosphate isomerase/epimerase [Armatimonadota bacterium]|nr:sugar phosphate isomerase/epimerase [Armatimonadota bacterium]